MRVLNCWELEFLKIKFEIVIDLIMLKQHKIHWGSNPYTALDFTTRLVIIELRRRHKKDRKSTLTRTVNVLILNLISNI